MRLKTAMKAIGLSALAVVVAAGGVAAAGYFSFQSYQSDLPAMREEARAHAIECIGPHNEVRRRCSVRVLEETPSFAAARNAAVALASSKPLMGAEDYRELEGLLASAYDREASSYFFYSIANACYSVMGDDCHPVLRLRARTAVLPQVYADLRVVNPRNGVDE
jgi:hypothetical protein